jgi:hypothetical protein
MICIFNLLIFIPFIVEAKIWRVNNRPGIAADFTTAQAANDGAVAGDTVYFELSPTSYGNLNVTKKLIIIGTGFFLSENPETQWKTNWPAQVEYVSIAANGAHSQIMGLTVNNGLSISAQNIIIKRNYIAYYVTITTTNVTFSGNFCSLSSGGNGFQAGTGNHDIYINNNIFVFYSSSYYSYPASISGTVISNGTFNNNTLLGYYSSYGYTYAKLNLDNYLVQNNITFSTNFYPNTNDYSYNIADNANFGILYGNQQNVPMASVILNSGSTDGKFQLKPGSPAIGAGYAGYDCGAFGGPNPYILSGLPPIPAIYNMFIGNTGSQVNVQVQVKSHN